jgi:hypothetical protein
MQVAQPAIGAPDVATRCSAMHVRLRVAPCVCAGLLGQKGHFDAAEGSTMSVGEVQAVQRSAA